MTTPGPSLQSRTEMISYILSWPEATETMVLTSGFTIRPNRLSFQLRRLLGEPQFIALSAAVRLSGPRVYEDPEEGEGPPLTARPDDVMPAWVNDAINAELDRMNA